MKHREQTLRIGAGLFVALALTLASGGSLAEAQALKDVPMPKPGVPEIFTIQGEFVRVAYNNEGYSSLGYRVANQSAGEEWMLLEIGLTLRQGGNKNFILKREGLSLSTPDGKTIPLPTNKEYRGGDLRALNMRAKVVRDSINYFPSGAARACRIGFFADLDSAAMPFNQVDLSWQRACMGRLYFKVPGGIQHGQHYLNVQLEKSKLRVPFRILTKDEEKEFGKSWEDIKKELDNAWAEAAKKKSKS